MEDKQPRSKQAPRRAPTRRVATRSARPIPAKRDLTLPIVGGCSLVALGAVVGAIWVTRQPHPAATIPQVAITDSPAPAAPVELREVEAPRRARPRVEEVQEQAPAPQAEEELAGQALSARLQEVLRQAELSEEVAEPAAPSARPKLTPWTPEAAAPEVVESEAAPEVVAPAAPAAPKTTLSAGFAPAKGVSARVQRLPSGEGESLPAAAETEAPSSSLGFGDALLAFLGEDDAELRRVSDRLGDAGHPDADLARGLVAFRDGDFPQAHTLLSAGEDRGAAVRDAALRAGLFAGRYDAVREALERDPDADPVLKTLAFGPFHARTPFAARALEQITPEGHYRVMTDLGLSAEQLQALDAKLGATKESSRETLVKRARKKHRGLQALAKTMDTAYAAYDKLFGIRRACEVVPTVYLFSDRGAFDEFSKRLQIGSTENVLGYYMPRYRVLVFYDRGGEKAGQLSSDTQETLMHETFHQWLHLYVADAPPWFNEGLAEYFGICKLERSRLVYGLVPPLNRASRLSNMRDSLLGMSSEPWGLPRLLTATQGQFMGSHPALNYAQSWSFVHYLASSKQGREKLRAYFRGLQAGVDQAQLFEQVFGDLPSEALQQSWRDYVLRLKA